jgi:hypothetical protein
MHLKVQAHGSVKGEIPAGKLKEFIRAKRVKVEKPEEEGRVTPVSARRPATIHVTIKQGTNTLEEFDCREGINAIQLRGFIECFLQIKDDSISMSDYRTKAPIDEVILDNFFHAAVEVEIFSKFQDVSEDEESDK